MVVAVRRLDNDVAFDGTTAGEISRIKRAVRGICARRDNFGVGEITGATFHFEIERGVGKLAARLVGDFHVNYEEFVSSLGLGNFITLYGFHRCDGA